MGFQMPWPSRFGGRRSDPCRRSRHSNGFVVSLASGNPNLCPIFHKRTKLSAAVARAGPARSSAWEASCASGHRSDSSLTRRGSGLSADPRSRSPGPPPGRGRAGCAHASRSPPRALGLSHLLM